MSLCAAKSELPTHLQFTREQWCDFRQDTPLNLTDQDLVRLHGQIEMVSLSEVEQIYVPLSRLLSLYVTTHQELHRVTSEFLGAPEPKVPYIIGVAGSVAVGKSTTSRVLQALLSHWPNHPRVDIITTDGFLYSNAQLAAQDLLQRKGFPESYNIQHLLQALSAIKSGQRCVKIPLYSHLRYDILPGKFNIIDQPDIVILEGLNILQTGMTGLSQPAQIFVSDFFDFSLFVDADVNVIEQWYIERVLAFSKSSFTDPQAYFHYLTAMNTEEIIKFAQRIWREINAVNLIENILPYKKRAQLILRKGLNHTVEKIYLRKI